MAAADEILGISGQLDISDIQKSFDQLLNGLDKLGIKTSDVGTRMTQALNAISQSAVTDSEKTQRAMQTLKDGIAEINKSLVDTPDAIKKVAVESQNAESTIAKLKDKLTKVGDDAHKWQEINDQIATQEKLAGQLNAEYNSLLATFGHSQQTIGVLSTAIDVLNAGRTISTVATGASAVAHTGAAIAVGAEAVAHAQNAKEINQESDSVQKSVQSFKDYEDEITAVKQHIAELQQRIIETKESIQFDKNDVTYFKDEQAKASSRYGSMSNAAVNAGNLANDSQQRVNEQTKALQSYQIELQKAKLELSQLKDEQKLQAEASKAQSEEFANIIAKIEQWKSSLSDINALNQKFGSQKEVIDSVRESIDELSKSSQSNTEYAKSLKSQIEEMSRTLRLSMVGDFDASKATEYYDKIQAKIKEYSEAVSYASGQSNAAVELQKEAIVGLETQLSSLKEQLQAAQATNNTEAAQAITTQIDALNTALIDAKNNLSALQTQSNAANTALGELANVEQQLNTGASRGSTLFGTIIDAASQLKDNVSDAFNKIKDKVSTKVDEIKGKASELKNNITENFSDISQRIGFDRLGEAFSSVGQKIGELNGKVVKFATGGGKFQESLGNIKTALNGLPMPLGNVLGSVKAVTSALWSMCATPIGAVLAAIVIGMQAVYQWFTKSAEGQKVFTGITAYLGSLLSSLTDIIVIFGKYLYHAFADAKGPMHDFATSFARTFTLAVKSAVSLLKGLGTTIKGIFTLDWDTFTDGLSQTWDGLKKAGQTVISGLETSIKGVAGALKTTYSIFTDPKLGKELGASLDGIGTKAKRAKELALAELNANIALSKSKEKQAELDIKIAANREKIYTLTGKAKEALLEETKILEKQKYEGQIKAQQQLYNIQKERNALHTTSLEDIKKERALHIDVLTTIAQQAASTRMLTRMQEANRRKMANEAKSEEKKDVKQQSDIDSAEGKLTEVEYKNASARIKAELSLESEVTDARISAMQEGAEKIIAERKRELAKEIEQIEEKKKAAIKAERDMQKAEFDAQQAVIKARGGKTESWNEEKHLNKEPIRQIEQKYEIIEKAAVDKSNNETLKEELDKWNEFVEKYGSIQQRIYTITEEYKKKITALRGSGDEIGASAAENEMKEKLGELQMQQVKDSIDWDSVFQDLESHSSQYLEKLRSQLKTLLSSGTLKIDDMKVVSDQINKVDDAISKQKSSWGIVNESIREHKRLVEEAKQAQLMLNEAQKEQTKAGLANTSKKLDIQGNLAAVGINAPMASITYENKDKYLSQVADPEKQKELKKMFDELGITETRLAKSTDEVAKAQKKLAEANDKTKRTFYDYMQTAADGLGGVYDKIKDLPALMDNLGLGDSGVGKAVTHGVNAISNAKDAAQSFATGNFIGGLSSSVSALKEATSIFGIGADNTAKMQEKIDQLNQKNSILAQCLEKLNETIENSSLFDAQQAYEDMIKLTQQAEQNEQSKMYYEAEKHGTWRVSLNKSVEDNRGWKEAMKTASAILGKQIKTSRDFLYLSAADMAKIRNYDQGETLNKILEEYRKEGGKNGKSGQIPDMVLSYIKEYANVYKEIDESKNTFMTSLSFDSVKDEFKSMLSDMTKSTADFASNFEDMMRNAIVKTLMQNTYNKMLESWYKDFTDAYKNDQKITPDEMDKLRKEYEDIVKDAIKERDALTSTLGISQSSQSATTKAISAITADQASTLTGIGYAMQIALEQGNDTRSQISADISVMRGYAETVAANMSEMRDIQYEGLGQLQQIVKNTAPIILIREDIASMYKLMKDRY